MTNLTRYEADLKSLMDKGDMLMISMQRQLDKKSIDDQIKKSLGDGAEKFIKDLPSFKEGYQSWYSESLAIIRQLLPDRLADFKSHYERPKTARKEITAANYVIDDFCQGLQITRGYDNVIVGPSAAQPRFDSQISILKACQARFKSSLFDIRQLVQADLMDDELVVARELQASKFFRAAGVVAGVVLEKHLKGVVVSRGLTVKARASLGDYVAALKDGGIVDTPEWRRLQHLSELRAKCTHSKADEPDNDDITDLIAGAARTIKNLF